MGKSLAPLQALLERAFEDYHREEYVSLDPLVHLRSGLEAQDLEILSFILAGLSYGRVEQILKSYSAFLERLVALGCSTSGGGIREKILEAPSRKYWQVALKGWVHRLNTAEDLSELLWIMKSLIAQHGSLCAHFQASYAEAPAEQLHLFGAPFRTKTLRSSSSKRWQGTGAEWFAPSPKDGSTCKRLMMWLRWMVRQDVIDPGLWQRPELQNPALPKPSTARLFYPVDTHIFQWARKNQILKTKSITWKSVESLTSFFRTIDAKDPVRFDFALCTQGKLSFREGLKKEVRSKDRAKPARRP
jgi:uncharacterized protein (TIGR02757 family)